MKYLAVLVIAFGAVIGAGDKVHAGAARDPDPVDDVKVYDWWDNEVTVGWWIPDIASVRVIHSPTRVRVVTRFHRLDRGLWDWFTVSINSDADIRDDYRFSFNWLGNAALYEGAYGGRLACPIRSHIDLRDDVVTVSAPRSCLGRPRAVSVRAQFHDQWPEYHGVDCCYNWAHDKTDYTAKARRG